jgi:hypothetical protein
MWTKPLDDDEQEFLEYLINGENPVKWTFWLAHSQLTAQEFSALACRVDPDNLGKLQASNATRIAERQRLIFRLAESDSKKDLAPQAWAAWLLEKGFDVPSPLRAAPASKPPHPPQGVLSKSDNFDPELQQMANEAAKSLRSANRPPTKDRVAAEISRALKKANSSKASLDVATIKKRIRTKIWKAALLDSA